MPSTASPYGLIPANHPSGVVRPFAMTITTGYASNIFQNSPVKIVPSSTGEGTIAVATAGDADGFIGTFQGVEFTDSDGRRRVSNKWTAGQVGTDVVAYVTLDPAIVYEIQANGTLDVDSIGKQFDYTTITAGNTTVGISQLMLDTGSSAANAQLRVIGLTPGPDNAWGDNYPVVQVQISQHQNVADKAAY